LARPHTGMVLLEGVFRRMSAHRQSAASAAGRFYWRRRARQFSTNEVSLWYFIG
jgi:hypothetical protein